jgi:dihydrolipoamide dehydrogenase
MAEETYDVVVIGSGPGGYVCSIRAAQLGLKVACVESRGALGGTCLNVGCIPSKALLQSSHHYEEAQNHFAAHGIKGKVELDLKTMMARKAGVVKDLTKGIEFLLKKNKVDYIIGTGTITDAETVAVNPGKGKKKITLKTDSIVIATGSESSPLSGVNVDEKRIVTSTGALELSKVPKSMIVIGAGVIGLEMSSVWRRLGTKVTVIEFLDRILPGMDNELAKMSQRILAKQGLEFRLATKATAATTSSRGVTVTAEPVKGGGAETLKTDIVLLAIGRRPYTAGLGLEAAGVTLDNRGRVVVDGEFQTAVPGIYAIGDVIHGPMLAHKAEEDGVALAELLAGKPGHVDYDQVPGIVYTWPEIAAVGATEEKLKEDGVPYKVGKFPFTANSRARANADTDGFVKVIAHGETDALLGCHIIGPLAGELIQEAVTVLAFGGSAEDIARICHGHPGMSEALKEAAMAVDGRAIHI